MLYTLKLQYGTCKTYSIKYKIKQAKLIFTVSTTLNLLIMEENLICIPNSNQETFPVTKELDFNMTQTTNILDIGTEKRIGWPYSIPIPMLTSKYCHIMMVLIL